MSDQLPELAKIAGQGGLGVYAAYQASGLLKRVLGPPADALGRRLARSVDPEHADRTVRVLQNAGRKVPDDNDGEMNPRVLGRVVAEVEWADDEVLVEYLGGILASAKTPQGRDDRGVMWTRKVGGMATYALRLHFIVYSVARDLCPGRIDSISDGRKLGPASRIFIPGDVFMPAMDFSEDEQKGENDPLGHAIFALASDGLIADDFALGGLTLMHDSGVPHAATPGLVVAPTAPGVELYMWAHGYGTRSVNDFLDPSLAFEYPPEIVIPPGSMLVTDMKAVDVASTEIPEVEPTAGPEG